MFAAPSCQSVLSRAPTAGPAKEKASTALLQQLGKALESDGTALAKKIKVRSWPHWTSATPEERHAETLSTTFNAGSS